MPLRVPSGNECWGHHGQWLILFVFLCAPQTVLATCGDHLSMPGGKPVITLSSDRAKLPEPRDLPVCNGPSCRRHLPIPRVPLSGPVQLAQDAILLVPSVLSTAGDELMSIQPEQDECPRGAVERIFRPPRSNA
jgi:hypothetical protein